MTQADRLFAETYSATRQRQAASAGSALWVEDYLGRMRLDLVAFRTIVVPDTHLFDGLFFLETSPERLGSELLRGKLLATAPLEIRHRANTLEESLASILVRGDRLNNFPFNSILDEEKRSNLALALGQRSRSDLEDCLGRSETVWDGMAEFLSAVSQADQIDINEEIEIMRRGWRMWLAKDRDSVQTVPWQRQFDLPHAARFAQFDAASLSDDGKDLLRVVWGMLTGGTPWRSDMTEVLRAAKQGATPESRQEVAMIGRFAERVRHRAIALQHECTYGHEVDDGDPESGRFIELANQVENSWQPNEVPSIPETAIRTLGLLPSHKWMEFTTDQQDNLEQWWTGRNESGLKRAVESLGALLEREEESRAPHQSRLDLYATFVATTGGSIAGAEVQGYEGAIVGAFAGGAIATLSTAVVTRGPTAWRRKSLAKRLFEYCREPAH
jgi:hypothetical protein